MSGPRDIRVRETRSRNETCKGSGQCSTSIGKNLRGDRVGEAEMIPPPYHRSGIIRMDRSAAIGDNHVRNTVRIGEVSARRRGGLVMVPTAWKALETAR